MSFERQRSCCQQRNISASRRDPSAGWAQGRLRRRGEMSEFACRSRTMKIGLFHLHEALAFGPLKRTLVTGRLFALPRCSLYACSLSFSIFFPNLSALHVDDAPHAANVHSALESIVLSAFIYSFQQLLSLNDSQHTGSKVSVTKPQKMT